MPHPDFATGQRGRETLSCAPFVDRPDQVELIWRDLARRVEAIGWRLPDSVLEDDPVLRSWFITQGDAGKMV